MARLSMSLFCAFVIVIALAVPAPGAVAAPSPPQDFVVGGGSGSGPLLSISVDARSDPSGGNASGTVSFVIVIGTIQSGLGGPVTCLAIDGNRAVIGFAEPVAVVVADGGPAGSDAFGVFLGATDCSTDPSLGGTPGVVASLLSGDIVVREAPTRAQCLDGGWRNYTDPAGHPLRSQGQCIAFALGT